MDKNIAKRRALQQKKRRVRSHVSGTPERPRLTVYRSERHIYGQLIDDISGRTLASASSRAKDLRAAIAELSPLETAAKVGESLAEKAVAAGYQKAVLDRNGRRYGGRVAALADGARSKGLQF